MTAPKYVIRPAHNFICGSGYELMRVRFWFCRSHVEYAWLRYDKDALNTLRDIVTHMGGVLV